MGITVRQEGEKDFRTVENVVRESFWNVYRPGCNEHLIVHNMRSVPAFVSELAFVASDDDAIVGAIFYSKAKVVNAEKQEFEVLCMGPLGVLPSYQGRGVGSLLMNHSLARAKQFGYNAIIIFGDPKYYHRFGFGNAEQFAITTSDGRNFDAFMALKLREGGLTGITGKYYYDEVFEVDEQALEAFDAEFPHKDKRA